jgi:hypothetical protein
MPGRQTTNRREVAAGTETGADSSSNYPFRPRQRGIAGKYDSCNPARRLRRCRARTTGRNIPMKCGPGLTPRRLKSESRPPSSYDASPSLSWLTPREEFTQREGEGKPGRCKGQLEVDMRLTRKTLPSRSAGALRPIRKDGSREAASYSRRRHTAKCHVCIRTLSSLMSAEPTVGELATREKRSATRPSLTSLVVRASTAWLAGLRGQRAPAKRAAQSRQYVGSRTDG